MTKPFLEKEKSAIIAYTCNLPSNFWIAGYYQVMTDFIERMGNRYASERVEAYRQHKLFTEEELQMFFDIEIFSSSFWKRTILSGCASLVMS